MEYHTSQRAKAMNIMRQILFFFVSKVQQSDSRVLGISKGLNKSLIKVGLRRGEGKIICRVNKL